VSICKAGSATKANVDNPNRYTAAKNVVINRDEHAPARAV
jgi:hypothetical protein